MDNKIIELLRLKGMGWLSSFLLQQNFHIFVFSFLLVIALWLLFIFADSEDWDLIFPLLLIGFIINFVILFVIGYGVHTPLNNLESIAINKKINITEYHSDYILDKNHHKYKIGLMKNINTSSFYKRSWFKDQINGHNTQVKLIKYKGDNIIINYTPQKRTVKGYDN